jgi:hypothetical protein
MLQPTSHSEGPPAGVGSNVHFCRELPLMVQVCDVNIRSNDCPYRARQPTLRAPETVSYGHGIGAVAVTTSANGNEPVVGAFGSEGERVLTGK